MEHRLFSHITMNWRGRPLTSHEVIVQAIAATTTRAGLRVRAELDTATYPPGVKVSNAQMAALPLHRHDWHGDWDYTLYPAPPAPAPPPPPRPGRGDRPGWAHPALTGMTASDWDQLTAALDVLYQAQREADRHVARGGPATRSTPAAAPGHDPRRENPCHHHAAAPGSAQSGPRRTLRRRAQYHRHSRTAGQAAASTRWPHHRPCHNPTHHPGRSHRIRNSSRHHTHAQDQTSALITDKPLA